MKKPTPLWKALFLEHRLPWRYTHKGGFWNTVLLGKIRPYYLKPVLFFKNLGKKEDITIVIGVKNRFDHRIKNAFKSIREQNYPQELIKVILVDYGSEKELIPKYKKLCKEHNVRYVRVDDKPRWSRAHCLNIGIKRADTKYILTSDIDIIFEKNYIKKSVERLKRDPFQVVLSCCLDLPKNVNCNMSFDELRGLSKKRFDRVLSKGINSTLTYFYHKIRGYDEFYKLWGAEDDDLIKRFKLLGLIENDISKKASYLHQWHSTRERVKMKGYNKKIRKNREYLNNTNSIVRNKDGWGEI